MACSIVNAFQEVYKDDKRETLNSLLRYKTPSPKRSTGESIAVKVASVVCSPFKVLKGVGMIAAGAVLWAIPCTVIKIKTKHYESELAVTSVSFMGKPPTCPFWYSDAYDLVYMNGNSKITKSSSMQSCGISCSIGQPSEGKQGYITGESVVTGYHLLTGGIGKIIRTALSLVYCCKAPYKECRVDRFGGEAAFSKV